MKSMRELKDRVRELEDELDAIKAPIRRLLDTRVPGGYWRCWRCNRLIKDGWRCCDE